MKALFSYVDPGMGLLLWQALVAAVVGLVFYVKKAREKVLAVLRRLFRAGNAPRAGRVKVPVQRDELPQ
jgi:hypothetical protein